MFSATSQIHGKHSDGALDVFSGTELAENIVMVDKLDPPG
jgi:hypothetical protein